MENKSISEVDKKKQLQSTIYNLTKIEPFYGNLLQQLTIKYGTMIPTAGVTFNTKLGQYEVYINPNFFNKLTPDQRVAVFQHEVLHFTNKHLFRLPFLDKEVSNKEKNIFNISGDMAINQFIKNLPSGCSECQNFDVKSPEDWESLHPTDELKDACPGKCINVDEWFMDDGSKFPKFKSMEEYYQLIKKESEQQKNSEEKKKEGKGQGTKGNVNEHLDKYKEFDQHMWDSLDEETKKKMLEEAKKVLERTIEKTGFNHSTVPGEIQDLLKEIDAMSASLNYKKILKDTIKRTVSVTDRENTWKKPNKRYGSYSPGTKVGALPKLAFFNDSSGSISITEQNTYLRIMDEFLKVGSRNCILGFWHTSLYYKKPYKRGQQFDSESLQSGGTDVKCVLEDIKKNKYDLSIILTDGYYDKVDIKVDSEIIWIISEGGNLDHPMKSLGKTIELEKIK
jgi:predicted metal-dependent peptidase